MSAETMDLVAGPEPMPLPGQRVALATSELPHLGASGGIGAAFHELALGLRQGGLDVWLFYAMDSQLVSPEERRAAEGSYARNGVHFRCVDPARWSDQPGLAARSWAVHRELTATGIPAFDWVHFADYHGLGFHFLAAITQGLVTPRPRTVVQLHGPTRWTLEVSEALPSDENQLIADWMERRSIEWADHLVCPSHYLAGWVEARYPRRRAPAVRVIKNAFRLSAGTGTVSGDGMAVSELIFYGRHEARKGVTDFCDAVDRLQAQLAARGGTVTFLGSFGQVQEQFSGLYLLERAAHWEVPVRLLPGLSRTEAIAYLRQAHDALVVVPSPRENSPYAVLEAIAADRLVLTSAAGGAGELLASGCREAFTCPPGGAGFAAAIERLLGSTALCQALAEGPQEVLAQWLAFHAQPADAAAPATAATEPWVSLVITHFERPAKLLEALGSVLRQDYAKLDIVVVDDGTTSEPARQQLAAMEPFLQRHGVRLVRQRNAYLGAARNRGLRESSGEFVLFLDDDDLALPTLVSTLVRAQQATGADALVAMNRYLPASQRGDYVNRPEALEGPVSYLPLGGPLSLSPVMNLLGAATVLLRRSTVESLGGYTELVNVGQEDHELLFALVANGADVRIVPEPLYLYEVGRPSMISATSPMRGHKRVLDRALRDGHIGLFADLLALASGRQAAAVGHGQTRSCYQSRHATDTEFELLDTPLAADVALGKLAEVAAHRGLPRLVRDLDASQAERQRIRSGTTASVERLIADGYLVRRQATGGPADLSLSVRAMELSGSPITAEAVAEFGQALCAAHPDQTANIAWVRFLPWARLAAMQPDVTRHLAVTTVALLRRQLAAGRLAGGDAVLAMSAEAWLTDTLVDGDRVGLAALVVADGRQYALDHVDVADAVRLGHFEDELAHYLVHGQHEGRPGFDLTRSYLSFGFGDLPVAARLALVRQLLAEPRSRVVASTRSGHHA